MSFFKIDKCQKNVHTSLNCGLHITKNELGVKITCQLFIEC